MVIMTLRAWLTWPSARRSVNPSAAGSSPVTGPAMDGMAPNDHACSNALVASPAPLMPRGKPRPDRDFALPQGRHRGWARNASELADQPRAWVLETSMPRRRPVPPGNAGLVNRNG